MANITRIQDSLTKFFGNKNTIFKILLGLYFAVAGYLMVSQSLTTDEPAHMGAGLAYIYGWGLNPEHPLLLKFFSGVLLFIFTPFLPQSRDQYGIGYEIILKSAQNPNLILFLSRLPYLLFNSLFVIYLWAGTVKKYFNYRFALILGVFYIFSTTLAPMAGMAIFDVAGATSAIMFVGLIYIFQRKLDSNQIISNKFLWLTGLSGFAAFNIKFSNVLIIGLFPVILIFNSLKYDKFKAVLKLVAVQASLLLVGIYMLNGFCYRSSDTVNSINYYQFSFPNTQAQNPPNIVNFQKNALSEILFKPYLIYAKGLQMSFVRSEDSSNTFFVDKYVPDTFSSLIIRVLPFKENPLLILLLPLCIVFGAWQILRNYNNWPFLKSVILLTILPLIYFGASFQSKLAIGIRHFDLVILAGYALIAYSIYKFFSSRILLVSILGIYILTSISVIWIGIGYTNIFWLSDSYLMASDSTMNWGQNANRPIDFLVKNKLISNYYNPSEVTADFCCSPEMFQIALEFTRTGNQGNKSYTDILTKPDIGNKPLINNPAKYLVIDGNTLQWVIHNSNIKANQVVVDNLAYIRTKPIVYNYVDQIFVYQLHE